MTLFITANDNERIAFLSKLENPTTKTFPKGVVCKLGEFGKYEVAHFHSPEQGNAAGSEIKRAIEAVSPDYLILVGVACGGDPKDQNIGDVLVSHNVIDYDCRKEDYNLETMVESTIWRGARVPSGDVLYRLFHGHSFDWQRQYKTISHLGDIITSSVLLNNLEKKNKIFSTFYDEPIGYEMEGMSAFRACRDADITQWLLVKGICDFGDGNKSHDKQKNQECAAKNAVSLCHYVFSQDNAFPSISNITPENPVIITHTKPLQPSDYFRGRNEKMEEVKRLLVGDAKLMLLNGMGGIGKTEFCRKLFHECINGKLPEVKKVGWLLFRENIEQTLFQQFSEITFQTDSPKEYLLQATNYLNDQKGELLLFVDNANELDQQDAALLSQLRCKVVLTSRRRSVERLQPIEIGKLTMEDCRILYRQHSEDYVYNSDFNYGVTFLEDDSPDEDLDAIISMADRHTLAVELLAKTQKSAAYTIREMRETLEKTGFSLIEIAESITYVHTPEIGEWDKAEQIFIEQFSKVLDISNIRNEKLRVLQLFSLLSTDTIVADNVREWFGIDDLDTVNALVSQGWVFSGRVGEERRVAFSMHPLITSVVRHKALPSFEIAAPLAIGLAEVLSYDDTDIFTNRIPHLSHAISLVEAITGQYDEYPDLINCIAIILNHMAEYTKALGLLERAKTICETVASIDPIVTSTVYHNLGGCYIRMGRIAEAKNMYKKAIDIREDRLEKDDSCLATSYDCIGNACEMLGNYNEAINYMKRGLEMRKTVLGDEHPQTAISYNNIGCLYETIGEYNKALEHHKSALIIQERTLDKYHPDLGATYNNLGHVYDRLGNSKIALDYFNLALEAGEAVFGSNHPEVFTARDRIADVYLTMGEYAKAEKIFHETLEGRLIVLGENHQDTAANYQNIGVSYYYQFEHERALDFLNKALKIEKSIFGARHPNVATILKNIADIYSDSDTQSMNNEALTLYKEVLNIQQEAFGENHPYVAISYNNIGEQCAKTGDYEQAMKNYQKALLIQDETVGRTHPDASGTLYNMGRVYEENGDLKQALDYFFEAYGIVKASYEVDIPEMATMSEGIAHTFDKLTDYTNANKWYESAIQLYIKFFGDTNAQLSVTYHLYGDSLERQCRYKEALSAFARAYEIQSAFYKPASEIMVNTERRISELKKKLDNIEGEG